MLLSASMPNQTQKMPPGAIRLNCLRCEKNGRTSCLGVVWQDEVSDDEVSRLRSEGIRHHGPLGPWWRLNIRVRRRALHNTDAGPRPRIGSPRPSVFYSAPHGVAEVNCLRCKRRVTLSAKALGRRADGRSSMLV
jgi:hypothetical protein